MPNIIRRAATTVATAVLLSGCAGQTIKTSFNPVDQPEVQSYYAGGWIVQRRETSNYVVELALRDDKQPWEEVTGLLYVANISESPLHVGIESIQFHQDDQQIALWSYDELEQQHISRAQSRRTALALGAMAQSINASQPQTSTTYGSGTAYGAGGSANYYGSSSTYSYDPAATAAAQAQIQASTQSGIANINSDLQQGLSSLQGYIQKTTVFPNQWFVGRFQSQMTRYDQRPESFYNFYVEVGTERFNFRFVEETDAQTSERKLF